MPFERTAIALALLLFLLLFSLHYTRCASMLPLRAALDMATSVGVDFMCPRDFIMVCAALLLLRLLLLLLLFVVRLYVVVTRLSYSSLDFVAFALSKSRFFST